MATEVVGRDEELTAIERWLDQPPPSALLIEGEAGMGKTTLVRAAVERARERSLRVLHTSPIQTEAQLSFAALGDLFEGSLDDVLSALSNPRRRALEAALLLRETEGPAPDERAVALAVLDGLRALSCLAVVVVSVDDVQWLDGPSASALGYAARRLTDERVGLVLSRRIPSAGALPLGLDRSAFADRVDLVRLGSLSLGALHRLLHERLGVSLPRPLLLRVGDASGGNPFFALEIARTLAERGQDADPLGPLPVPPALSELVRDRISSLPAATRTSLVAAAALSRPTVSLVAGATGSSETLRPALDANVITVTGGRLRFTHPLLASAAYADADHLTLHDVHRRLAAAVGDDEERARHLALAADEPDADVAAASEKGALHARERGATAAAADLAEHAYRLTPPELDEDARRRATLAADWWIEAGDPARARSLLDDALGGTDPGDQRADLLARLGWAFAGTESLEIASRYWRRALDESPAPKVELSVRRGLSWVAHNLSGDLRTAARESRLALTLAEQSGNATDLAVALGESAFIDALRGNGIPHAALERACDLERDHPDLPILGSPSWLTSILLACTGELDEARKLLTELGRRATERGHDTWVVFVTNWLARVECFAGRWERADDYAEETYQSSRETGLAGEQAYAASTRAMVDARLGRTESARRAGREALEIAERVGLRPAGWEARATLGFLELSLGRADEAIRWLGSLDEEVRGAGFDEPTIFRFHADTIEALVALGEVPRAEELTAYLEERGRTLGRTWALATSARCGALTAGARGDTDHALACLAEAQAEHDRLAEPFEHARALLVEGTVLRRLKRKRAAREALEASRDTFQNLGARVWASRVEAELSRVGGRPTASGELTPREREVAELVAKGLSNKEVAASLFVTPRTVETTLSRIYRKLGVHSRTELARFLREPESNEQPSKL